MKNQDKKATETLVKNLNKNKNIKAASDIGSEGKYRICVTWKTWVGQTDYINWWKALPGTLLASIRLSRI